MHQRLLLSGALLQVNHQQSTKCKVECLIKKNLFQCFFLLFSGIASPLLSTYFHYDLTILNDSDENDDDDDGDLLQSESDIDGQTVQVCLLKNKVKISFHLHSFPFRFSNQKTLCISGIELILFHWSVWCSLLPVLMVFLWLYSFIAREVWRRRYPLQATNETTSNSTKPMETIDLDKQKQEPNNQDIRKKIKLDLMPKKNKILLFFSRRKFWRKSVWYLNYNAGTIKSGFIIDCNNE